MSYPRNAASPERVDIGPVIQITDGAVQTSGVAVKVIPFGGTEAAGGGTVAYSADGVVLYTPTQAETNYTSFVLVAAKTGCIPASKTVVTSASNAAGYAGLDWSKITAATSTVALTGTTISTSQVVASVTGNVGGSVASVIGNVGGNVLGSVSSVIAGVTVTTNNDKSGYTLTVTPPTAAAIADAVWDEAYSGHTTAGTFGKLMDILRKSNTVVEGTVLATPTPTASVFRISGADYPTGAMQHAVLWFASGPAIEQNNPILTWLNNGDGTVTITLEAPLVSVPTAGDLCLIAPSSHVHAIAEIQSGLATLANQGVILDRTAYALTVLAGACSDAQTAAETYTLTIGGNTFTVDYSGLDASGNRGATTLSKV